MGACVSSEHQRLLNNLLNKPENQKILLETFLNQNKHNQVQLNSNTGLQSHQLQSTESDLKIQNEKIHSHSVEKNENKCCNNNSSNYNNSCKCNCHINNINEIIFRIISIENEKYSANNNNNQNSISECLNLLSNKKYEFFVNLIKQDNVTNDISNNENTRVRVNLLEEKLNEGNGSNSKMCEENNEKHLLYENVFEQTSKQQEYKGDALIHNPHHHHRHHFKCLKIKHDNLDENEPMDDEENYNYQSDERNQNQNFISIKKQQINDRINRCSNDLTLAQNYNPQFFVENNYENFNHLNDDLKPLLAHSFEKNSNNYQYEHSKDVDFDDIDEKIHCRNPFPYSNSSKIKK